MKLLQGIKRRIAWERYRLGVTARWLQWDYSEAVYSKPPLPAETVYEHGYANPLADDPVAAYLLDSRKASHPPTESLEFVRRLHCPVMLEPDFGYAIASPGRLVPLALCKSECARDRSQMQLFSGVPSIEGYKAAINGRKAVRKVPKVITFRHPFGGNYFHFIADILSRIYLLDLAGIDPEIPLVVDANLAKTTFFKDMVKRGSLRSRNWMVQGDEYIQTDDLVYVQTSEDNPDKLIHLLDHIGVRPPDPSVSRRIFLTRSERRGRNVTNMSELLPILEEFGIEVIDTDGWSIDDQINLFQESGLIVGLHGAGLTNIIYRYGAPLKLLEVSPPSYTSLSFYQISKHFGYDYDFLTGSDEQKMTNGISYRIDPKQLRDKLSNSLSYDK